MQVKQNKAQSVPLGNERKNKRGALELPGRLSTPAGAFFDCRVVKLSDQNATIWCDKILPLETCVALHVEGFGDFQCVATRYDGDRLVLRFVCGTARRKRVLAEIANFVEEGMRLRQRRNMPVISEIRFTRPNGEQFRCGVEEVSSTEIWLRTEVRPPLGEIIYVGQAYGRVMHHHREGIAIQFGVTDLGSSDQHVSGNC